MRFFSEALKETAKIESGEGWAMGYNVVSFEKRKKENIRDYAIRNLYSIDILTEQFEILAQEYQAELLLTDRHGEKAVVVGSFDNFNPDVVKEPGEKLRICDRTIGHLYTKEDRVPEEKKDIFHRMLAVMMKTLAALGTETYMHRECVSYMEELEKRLEKEKYQNKYGQKEDILTGVFNKNYLESRMKVLDRSEIVPIAVINVNINDWKFVYDSFGVEKSDSLIQLVASILMQEAKPEYIIGRIDGDVFLVLIPMAEDGEAEAYAKRIQGECMAYEDSILAPSVAVGIVYKTNVEESLEEKASDAEYEMFNNKLEIKNAPGYQERLRKGLAQK